MQPLFLLHYTSMMPETINRSAKRARHQALENGSLVFEG